MRMLADTEYEEPLFDEEGDEESDDELGDEDDEEDE